MAKGDSNDAQTAINTQGGLAQNNLNNLRNQQNAQYSTLNNLFSDAANRGTNLSNEIGGGYQNFLSSPGVQPNFGAYGTYQNFANTGGYSPQDIQDIRARDIAPTRAIYANAQADLDRQRALQGGYSPNYAAASSQMARNMSNQIGDANVNANASIADAIRQGKLAGAQGMTGIDQAIANLGLANRAQTLQGLSGQTSLYGTAPGAAGLYGNQMLNASGQLGNTQGLQNQIAQMIIQGQLNKGQIPGNFQSAMGNISSVLGLAGQGAGMASGMGLFGPSIAGQSPAVNPFGMSPNTIGNSQQGPF